MIPTAIGLFACMHTPTKPANQEPILPISFRLDGHQFQPAKLSSMVNALRSLGKTAALVKLNDYATAEGGDPIRNQTVEIICRFLFVRPVGWSPPALGGTWPDTSLQGRRQFPFFPIAISKGVPFMLISGYGGTGVSRSPTDTLRICQTLDMIEKDITFPNTNAPAAAMELIGSTAFKEIYTDDAGRDYASEFLKWQAISSGTTGTQ
jgi:hypothetical protein